MVGDARTQIWWSAWSGLIKSFAMIKHISELPIMTVIDHATIGASRFEWGDIYYTQYDRYWSCYRRGGLSWLNRYLLYSMWPGLIILQTGLIDLIVQISGMLNSTAIDNDSQAAPRASTACYELMSLVLFPDCRLITILLSRSIVCPIPNSEALRPGNSVTVSSRSDTRPVWSLVCYGLTID